MRALTAGGSFDCRKKRAGIGNGVHKHAQEPRELQPTRDADMYRTSKTNSGRCSTRRLHTVAPIQQQAVGYTPLAALLYLYGHCQLADHDHSTPDSRQHQPPAHIQHPATAAPLPQQMLMRQMPQSRQRQHSGARPCPHHNDTTHTVPWCVAVRCCCYDFYTHNKLQVAWGCGLWAISPSALQNGRLGTYICEKF